MLCAHHPACPGCPLLDLEYPLQLERKQARLAAAFAHYPHLPAVPTVEPALYTEGYRHRLKLPVHITDDHVSIGLYERNGRRILDTPDCPVLEPGLRAALPPILGWMRHKRGIHSLDLRRSNATGQLQAVFACENGELPGGGKAARSLLHSVPGLRSVAVSRADPEGKRVMGAGAEIVAGHAVLDESIGNTRYRLHPGAFFQVDPRQAVRIHELVREYVGAAPRVLDLYSGVGAYALMLAEGREKVVAVEELPAAARAAKEMAPRNVEVINRRVEDLNLEGKFDAVVINPARRGSDPETLIRVSRIAPRLVYVSCGPETLARDLDCLAAHGLRATAISPVDLFPQTPEVETVVLLERAPPFTEWTVPGGKAVGPWGDTPSGAKGRPTRLLTMVVGDPGQAGSVPGGKWRRVGMVATHALLRVDLDGAMIPALAGLARAGHPVAGRDPRTKRFFSDKAGLVRPFVHVEEAGNVRAPLHGDLVQALEALGADPKVLARVASR